MGRRGHDHLRHRPGGALTPRSPGHRLVVLADGTRLWTTTTGSGPPVVLLHGGPGLWCYLADVAELLAADHAVVRLDQRGCGRSTGAEGPFTLAGAVDDLEQLRRSLGIERWGLVGHSWGAELALRYAAAHPARTTAVAHVAGVGTGDDFWAAYAAERDRRLGPDLARWRELAGRARDAAEEEEWCLLQWRPDASPTGDPDGDARALWATRPPGARTNDRASRELWADRARHDLSAVLPAVEAPVTVVAGADDPRPWATTDHLVVMLPRARRYVLGGAGHAPWVERPQDVQHLLRRALRGGDTDPPAQTHHW